MFSVSFFLPNTAASSSSDTLSVFSVSSTLSSSPTAAAPPISLLLTTAHSCPHLLQRKARLQPAHISIAADLLSKQPTTFFLPTHQPSHFSLPNNRTSSPPFSSPAAPSPNQQQQHASIFLLQHAATLLSFPAAARAAFTLFLSSQQNRILHFLKTTRSTSFQQTATKRTSPISQAAPAPQPPSSSRQHTRSSTPISQSHTAGFFSSQQPTVSLDSNSTSSFSSPSQSPSPSSNSKRNPSFFFLTIEAHAAHHLHFSGCRTFPQLSSTTPVFLPSVPFQVLLYAAVSPPRFSSISINTSILCSFPKQSSSSHPPPRQHPIFNSAIGGSPQNHTQHSSRPSLLIPHPDKQRETEKIIRERKPR